MRHMHYKPFGHELTNWEWCGTRMSLDSEHTEIKGRVTCGRCKKKMKLVESLKSIRERGRAKDRLSNSSISRAAVRLVNMMTESGKERYTLIDHFVGEKPHAMVIVAVTPEHCAKILKQLKKWLNLPKRKA